MYLLYFFFKTEHFKFRWWHLVYFLPFVFMVILNIPVMFRDTLEKKMILQELINNGIPYLANDFEWVIHSIYNCLFTYLIVFTGRVMKNNEKKYLDVIAIVWVVVFTSQLIYVLLFNIFHLKFEQNVLFVEVNWIISTFLFSIALKHKTKKKVKSG